NADEPHGVSLGEAAGWATADRLGLVLDYSAPGVGRATAFGARQGSAGTRLLARGGLPPSPPPRRDVDPSGARPAGGRGRGWGGHPRPPSPLLSTPSRAPPPPPHPPPPPPGVLGRMTAPRGGGGGRVALAPMRLAPPGIAAACFFENQWKEPGPAAPQVEAP